MNKSQKSIFIFLVAILWFAIDQLYKPEVTELQNYQVIKVIDGDTISVNIYGEKETIRLIGIDTPETVHPTKPVECFGIEASNYAKSILENKVISIELDPSQGKIDSYGRTLGYIFLPDGTNFNNLMIKEGYAYEYTYNDPYKYQKEFKESEMYARENELGLWEEGVCE